MAAGISKAVFKGLRTGRDLTVLIYEAGADAAGTLLPMDSRAVATADSSTSIQFDEPMQMIDFIARSTTSGMVRWVRNGQTTQAIHTMSSCGGTNAGRPRPGYKFLPNTKYELEVLQALDA